MHSCRFDNNYFAPPITESTDSGSASVKKEKEKKNRKKDKENGSGSGEAGNQDNFDAPQAVVGFLPSSGVLLGFFTKQGQVRDQTTTESLQEFRPDDNSLTRTAVLFAYCGKMLNLSCGRSKWSPSLISPINVKNRTVQCCFLFILSGD